MNYIIAFLLFTASSFALTTSSFNPDNFMQFSKNSMSFAGQKVTGVVPAGQTVNIDMTVADIYLLTGAGAKAVGACESDEIKFQVLMGTTVVPNGTFIDWYMIDGKIDKDLMYPARIEAGLKLRAVYKNTCPSSAVNVYVNYYLHKVTQ